MPRNRRSTGLSEKSLTEKIRVFRNQNILVVGDVMLDEHIWSTVSRISPEAPVPVATVNDITHVPGGAGNVAANIAALGGKPILIGVLGKDSSAGKLTVALKKSGVSTKGLVYAGDRPTTLKSRVIAHQQHVVRVDREDRSPISPKLEKRIFSLVQKSLSKVQVVILSDYGKGLLTGKLCRNIIHLANKKKRITLVDPKMKDLKKYAGAWMVTPNLSEASASSNMDLDTDKDCVRAGQILLRQARAQNILITRGPEGMSLVRRLGNPIHIPAILRKVFDITGAGDTVIATFALSLSANLGLVNALILATCAAGVAIGKVGTSPVTRTELSQFLSEDHYINQITRWRVH